MTSPFYHKARFLVVAILLLSSVLIGISIGAATVAGAQANQTSTPEPAAGSVGPITVLDYRLKDGTMRLTIDVERPTAYALSDALAGLRQEGVTEVPVKQGTLDEGRQTLSLSVSVVDDAGAVTLSTPGEAIRIQTAAVESGKEPVDYETVQGLVAGSALFAAAGVYYWVKRRQSQDDLTSERIL